MTAEAETPDLQSPSAAEEVPRQSGAAHEPTVPEEPKVPDDALGGRLFDRFYDGESFEPDRSATPGVADGRGGPLGDGTLPLADGTPLLNDDGHGYRLKSFFGWDLRGAAGIYGPAYQNKRGVVPWNLLDESLAPAELEALLRDGRGPLPAYGRVLPPDEMEALVAFVLGVREGRLPHPDQVWSLSEGTPGNYRLARGGDAENGKRLFAKRCVRCHGEQGTKLLLDDGAYSLGSHARQKAYEDWLKILNGQPHTSMTRFVQGADGAALAREILDLLAALCDRTAFPLGDATQADVQDGDPRCGEYLR